NQWLLGLDPRVIGVWDPLARRDGNGTGGPGGPSIGTAVAGGGVSYRLYMCASAPEESAGSMENGECTEQAISRKALALMNLEYVERVEEHDGSLFLFRVLSTQICHIDPMRARLLFEKFYRKPGVTFERLKAVAAAYSYPRRVRIISFHFDDGNNYIFPMDLLADIRPAGRYLLGMRHSNQVLKKIMDVGRIVVAEAPAAYKQVIYKLGRNHSAAPPPLDQLPFPVVATRTWGFVLPEWVESYKEIQIERTLDLGSHMLLCGDWKEEVVLRPATPRLHHLHFLYYLHQKGGRLQYPVMW
ncbi:MAG TPA: hypothetical protein VKU83_04390, partial [Puia sp.]|nr:hypothetical protein [Puia sp.]